MTILVSTTSPDVLVMLSDSALTVTHVQEDGSSFNTYETTSKFLVFPSVGCITTWGDHLGNHIGSFLQGRQISATTHTVADLAHLVEQYLHDEYSRDDELGFHIAGFDRQGAPHLFHTFFGFDRPRPPTQTVPDFRFYDHSDWAFLYNGRNDLAAVAMLALEYNIRGGADSRFDLTTPLGRIMLCDLVARFAAEITPQVGPPFTTHLIFPDNSVEKVVNVSLTPIGLQNVLHVLPRLTKPGTPPPTRPAPPPEPPPALHMPTGTPLSSPPSATPPRFDGTLNYPPTGISH